MNKEKLKKLIIGFILFILAVTICYQCDTNPIIENYTDVDSSVFIYIAKSMKEGMLPYKDIFDHKGPLLYLINYIGILISDSSYIGIWLIEILFMTINLIYLYKISKLFIKNKFLSLIPVIVSVMPISIYMQGGNFTEEYALPFIIISLYYMIKCIKNQNNIMKKESFIIGICFSCVLLLRPNMVSVWIVYCISIFIDMIIHKKYVKARETVIYFVFGMSVILIICIISLLFMGILLECIDNYIIFNFAYIQKSEESLLDISKLFYSTTPLIGMSIFVCIIDIIIRIYKNKGDFILPISSILYSILTFFIVVIPKNNYMHYGIILIPTFIIPILLCIEIIKNNKYRNILCIIVPYVLCFLSLNSVMQIIKVYKLTPLKPKQYNSNLCKIINENSDATDKIIVIGNKCSIYLQCNRTSASKYIYQYPIIHVDKKIKDDFLNDLKSGFSKLIIYDNTVQLEGNNEINEIIQQLLQENKYKKISMENQYKVLERNF